MALIAGTDTNLQLSSEHNSSHKCGEVKIQIYLQLFLWRDKVWVELIEICESQSTCRHSTWNFIHRQLHSRENSQHKEGGIMAFIVGTETDPRSSTGHTSSRGCRVMAIKLFSKRMCGASNCASAS